MFVDVRPRRKTGVWSAKIQKRFVPGQTFSLMNIQ